jgi:hypothetical protein
MHRLPGTRSAVTDDAKELGVRDWRLTSTPIAPFRAMTGVA